MALKEYNQKRDFKATPEPKGGKAEKESLRFVVQKHHASRLHYDFRLEMKGVLKSWAVPKGPSLNPDDRRLAIQVEDHPYDYKDFEGTIPKGNYGAGTLIVWDEGGYEPLEKSGSKKAMEDFLLEQLEAGSLKIRLAGKKLRGEFALVKMKNDTENAWLLIKHKDEFASQKDVTKEEKSVVSGKTLDQVKAAGKTSREKKTEKKSASDKNEKDEADPAALKELKSKPFPASFSPMLATSTKNAFDREGWIFEIKWDGYRTIAFADGDHSRLRSRNGKSLYEKFSSVLEEVRKWQVKALIDGEVVAPGPNGIPDFSKLQNWKSSGNDRLQYYVFDILWYAGKDLTKLPLSQRQRLLRSLLPSDSSVIRMGFSSETNGVDFFNAALELGMEGMVAKNAESTYQEGVRSPAWLKVKGRKTQEAIIGGYFKLDDTSRSFSSLLLGVYEKDKLRYIGKVGTGFSDEAQKEMLRSFEALERKTSPFDIMPPSSGRKHFFGNGGKGEITWLSPEIVCEVAFTEQTPDGLLRHPVFVGIREDKSPGEVTTENETVMENKKSDKQVEKPVSPKGKGEGVSFPSEKVISGHRLGFTNTDKVLWPDSGITKGDMLAYYDAISSYMVPYLKDRPQSLNRFPDGIEEKNFFQKDVTGKVPDWVEKYPYKTEEDPQTKHYMLCNNKAALLFMANLGSIEMHPWNSTVKRADHPTWCAFDLDPDDSNTFDQVIEVALSIRGLLSDLKIESYCKTSGSSGLHIYIPLGAKYSYDQTQLFAKWVASQIDDLHGFTSTERKTDKRKGKIYIDVLQNRSAATMAAPYSIRAKPLATVSAPLRWEEVKPGLKITGFTIKNMVERVKSEGDLFKPVLGKGIDLKNILKSL